jgi:hypothetical protein
MPLRIYFFFLFGYTFDNKNTHIQKTILSIRRKARSAFPLERAASKIY